MKRRVLAVLLGCALVGVGVALVWQRWPKEPEYQGKKLSEWVIASWPGSPCYMAGGLPEEAIHKIGTNGLPFLVQSIQHKTPQVRKKFYDQTGPLAVKAFGWPFVFHTIIRFDLQEDIAVVGFRVLGNDAKPAIPDLVKALNPLDKDISAHVACALAGIGGDALPRLLDIATNNAYDIDTRIWTIGLVGGATNVGASSATLADRLVSCLQDEKLSVFATRAIGKLNIEKAVTTPALVHCLESGSVPLREATTNALLKIAPEVLDGH